MRDTTECKAEEEHDGCTDNSYSPEPIYRSESGKNWCLGSVDVENEDKNAPSETANGDYKLVR
jgi:hypothetical protein